MKRTQTLAQRRFPLELLGVLALGAFLRFYKLGLHPFTMDEAHPLNWVKKGFLFILTGPNELGDYHPPLSRIFLWATLFLGEGEAFSRIPFTALGVLSIYLTYLVGRELFDRKVAFLGTLIMAVSSFQLYHSREVRMYPITLFLSLLATYFLLKALREGRTSLWIGFTLAHALNFYTYYVAFFVLLSHVLLVLLERESRLSNLKSLAISAGFIFLLFLPWVPMLLSLYGIHEPRAGEVAVRGRGLVIPYSLFIFSVGETFAKVRSLADLTSQAPLVALSAIVFGLPFLLALRVEDGVKRALLLLLTPIVMLYLLTWKFPTAFLAVRYVIMVSPFFFLLLARGLYRLKEIKTLFYPILILIIFINLFSTYNYFFSPRFAPEDWRKATHFLEERAGGEDLILITSSYMVEPFDYYFKGNVRRLPLRKGDRRQWLEVKERLRGRGRVWLILSHARGAEDLYLKGLNEAFRGERVYRAVGIEIYEFSKRQ